MRLGAATQRAWLSWTEAPRLGLADLAAMLWTERTLVLSVGAAICALGLVAAIAAPRTYTARAEMLVRLGQEYVYQPTAGGAGAGAAPDMQAVVNAEMRMMGSGAVVRGAIERIGLSELYPEIAHAPGAQARRLAAAERAFAQNLTIETAPQTPSVALSFDHRDAEMAARALNALIDAYLAHRRDVLVGGEYAALSEQSADVNARASQASSALASFLAENGVGDFEAELAALSQRTAEIETQTLDAQMRRREAEARAGALRTRIRSEPAEIQLYSESDARRELVEAQLEREQLLSRYQEDAMPVREVDRRIAQLQSFLSSGDPASLTRRGVNPVRQDLETQLYTVEAEARAQAGRERALAQQREEVRARLQQMHALEPRFRQLQRERAILDDSAQAFASRAEDARSRTAMLGRATDNITPVERATAPTRGKSLRWPIMIVTVLIAAIVAVAAGLSRALMRRRFPTPTSAARTLETPVLAVMPRSAQPSAGKTMPVRSPKDRPPLTLVEGGAS